MGTARYCTVALILLAPHSYRANALSANALSGCQGEGPTALVRASKCRELLEYLITKVKREDLNSEDVVNFADVGCMVRIQLSNVAVSFF